MDSRERAFIIAERIKTARKHKGLSHAQLSTLIMQKTGVRITKASLMNYEICDEYHSRAERTPTIKMKVENLLAIADTLDCSVNYLLGIDTLPDMQDSVFFEETRLHSNALDWLRTAVKDSRDAEIMLLNLLFTTGAIDHVLSGFAFYTLASHRTITVTDAIDGTDYTGNVSNAVERDISKFVAQQNISKALDLVRNAMEIVDREAGVTNAEES